MLKLSELKPKHGARKRKIRLGRGESSGHGKTSGKGGKGQTARSGGTINPGFEGGQMPLIRRLPKYGFVSNKQVIGKNRYDVVNLSVLERFEAGSTVDAKAVWARGYGRTNSTQAGVKILGKGTLSKKLHVKVQAISEAAKSAIEKAGGSVDIVDIAGKAIVEKVTSEKKKAK
jgi:large subunit ribosomal protein L15